MESSGVIASESSYVDCYRASESITREGTGKKQIFLPFTSFPPQLHHLKSTQRPIGAVIVDPITNEVKAVAHDESSEHPLHHAVMIAINRAAEADRATNVVREHYLCTDYHIYLTREPCFMYPSFFLTTSQHSQHHHNSHHQHNTHSRCAMAILHSRFGRVYYGSANKESGGLGSKFKIHATPELNHHFEAFKGLLAQECDSLQHEKKT